MAKTQNTAAADASRARPVLRKISNLMKQHPGISADQIRQDLTDDDLKRLKGLFPKFQGDVADLRLVQIVRTTIVATR